MVLCSIPFNGSPLLNRIHFEGLASQVCRGLLSFYLVTCTSISIPGPRQIGLINLLRQMGLKIFGIFDLKTWLLFRKPLYIFHLACASLFMPSLRFRFLCIHFYKLKFSTFFMVLCSGNILHETYPDFLGQKGPFPLWVPITLCLLPTMILFLYTIYYSY